MTFLTVGGVRLHHTRTGGDGPVVVLAHGITDSGACWRRLTDALAGDHDVVAYDARGHGRSDRAPSYSPADHADDLVGLIDALAPAPVVLVGHSMGGVTVAWAAAERPDAVRAVVAEDPHWPVEPEGPDDYDLAGWQRDLAADNARTIPELIAAGRRDNPLWTDDDLAPWAEAKRRADPAVPTWLLARDELAGWRPVLAGVRCPVLLVTGEHEVTVTPQGAADAVAANPLVTVAHIDGTGHSIRRDRFEPYLAAVRPFLATGSRAG